jgi:hypothetical protein
MIEISSRERTQNVTAFTLAGEVTMRARMLVTMSVLAATGCGGGGGGGGQPNDMAHYCSFGGQLATAGQLGWINWVGVNNPPGLQQLDVHLTDYATTCGGTDAPPSYSAQNVWHGIGFSISVPNIVPAPISVAWDATGTDPAFISCAVGYGVGGGFPTNPPPACLGGSYECAAGSTVMITSASESAAAGMYDLNVNNGIDPPFSVSGSFSISGSCQGI